MGGWTGVVLAAEGYAAAQPAEIPTWLVIFYWAVVILVVVGFWKTFTKAGKPGWGAIIPFYNIYLLCQIAGRPGWWLVLFLIPVVNIVVTLIVSIDVAKAFGKGAGFGIGLWLLGFVFYPILGFGSATYQGPAASGTAAA